MGCNDTAIMILWIIIYTNIFTIEMGRPDYKKSVNMVKASANKDTTKQTKTTTIVLKSSALGVHCTPIANAVEKPSEIPRHEHQYSKAILNVPKKLSSCFAVRDEVGKLLSKNKKSKSVNFNLDKNTYQIIPARKTRDKIIRKRRKNKYLK